MVRPTSPGHSSMDTITDVIAVDTLERYTND
jgi:hypothetical protein